MSAMRMPGFTAGTSLRNGAAFLQSASRARNPFSGSCGCNPYYCCCILCWYNNCYWWCWAPARVPIGY